MKYCVYCGAEINDKAVICPKCGCDQRGHIDPKDRKFCAVCGAPVAGTSGVCPKCGCEFETVPEIASVPEETAKSKDVTPMVLGILSIVLGGIVGIVLGAIGYKLSVLKRDKSLNEAGLILSCVLTGLGLLAPLIYFIIILLGGAATFYFI